MKCLSSAVGILVLAGTTAHAQVPVTDAANTKESIEIKELSRRIQSDTSTIKDSTLKTLQAVTGDRTGEASQFSKLATGQGFSMRQAPDFSSILEEARPSLSAIGGAHQAHAAQLINSLKLIKTLVDQVGGGTANARSYDQAVRTLTTMTALTDAMNSSVKLRTSAFEGASGQIGRALDLKGALEQNTQMVLQGNETTNEAVGSLNNQVHLLNQQHQAGIAAMSERMKAFEPIGGGESATRSQDVGARLRAYQDRRARQ